MVATTTKLSFATVQVILSKYDMDFAIKRLHQEYKITYIEVNQVDEFKSLSLVVDRNVYIKELVREEINGLS